MRKLLMSVAAVTALGLLGVGAAMAQQMMPNRGTGSGPGMAQARMFDPKAMETFTGEIVSVDKSVPSRHMSYGVHAMVKTNAGTVSVHLGPDWYMEQQRVKLAPKDKVEVTGSRITFDGKPAIVATQVVKGRDVLTLRDANGVPAWAGHRRGR